MRKNVGKRIMEIADIVKSFILAIAILTGSIYILAGINALIATEDFSSDVDNLIIPLVIKPIITGIFWIVIGSLFAEYAKLLTYGFGILVDKAEHLKTEHLENSNTGYRHTVSPTKSTPSSTTKSTSAPVIQHSTVVGDEYFVCPNCGQKNMLTRTTCWRCEYSLTENEAQ